MALATWLRALDAVTGLIDMAQRLRPGPGTSPPGPPGGALMTPPETGIPGSGPLEARLAGVVVAALKEAFDRDRTRLDLEASQLDAERRRAEEALRMELRRQAGDRAFMQLRMLVVVCVVI